MRKILNIFKAAILIFALIIACAPGVHRPAVDKDSRTGAEYRFDPLGFAGDDAVITGKNKVIPKAPALEDTANSVEQTFDDYSTGNLTGNDDDAQQIVIFRVQVYASKSFDDAQKFASNIEGMFPEGVFVEYQMPYYKVRVGEFYSPDEGEVFLDEVKQIGFKNAWLVRVIQ